MIVNIDTLNLVQITEPIVTLRKYWNLHKSKESLPLNNFNTKVIYTRLCTYLVSMIGCSLKWKSLFDRIEKERYQTLECFITFPLTSNVSHVNFLLHRKLSSMDDRFMELQDSSSRKEYQMTKYFYITCFVFFILVTTVNVILKPNYFGLPINFIIPFLPMDKHSFFWILNYSYQLMVLLLAAIIFVGFASMLSILLNHSCWSIENVMIHVELLNDYMRDTSDNDEVGPSCLLMTIGQKSIKISQQLEKIYMMHLRVLDYNANVQNLIKFVLLSEFLIFRFAISLCIYILATNFFGSTYILLLLIVLLTQLFVCCYMGNRLKMQIDKLTNIVYGVKWDELEVNQQKVITILLRATQHMHEFNGIFTPLNFESFQQVKFNTRVFSFLYISTF